MIDYAQIQTFFVVLMALIVGITQILNFVEKIRKTKEDSQTEQNKKKIENHERRITKLEESDNEKDQSIKLLCEGVLALLSHSINGNSIDKLKDAKDELEKYLINK